MGCGSSVAQVSDSIK
jgi:hypothetical protein